MQRAWRSDIVTTVVLQRCYNDDPNLTNALCNRITRLGVNPSNNTVSRVDSSFVNLGLVTSKGYDINARYIDDFSIGDNFVEMEWSATGTNYSELKEQIDPESRPEGSLQFGGLYPTAPFP